MADISLRVVLWFLGQCIAQGSRFMPSVRSQITRTLTVELSAGTTVARHWAFDATRRRAVSHPGPALSPDCSLHFRSSEQALRALLSSRAVHKIVDGRLHGSVDIGGSALVVLWFYGLTRKFVKIGRERQPRKPVPGAYLAHDPGANGAETIVIEPAVVRLDPAWKGAWEARSTLSQVRGCTGEPMPEP